MLNLYITRHGQTIMNNQRRYQGSLDSALSEDGINAVKDLATALEPIEFDTVYCSPMGRTIQTANILLNNRDVPINYCDRLKELDFGILEGQPIDSFEQLFPQEYKIFHQAPDQMIPIPKMEPFMHFHQRVESCLHDILKQHDSGNILIVCHGLVVRSMLKIASNRSWGDYWIDGHVPGASLSIVAKTTEGFTVTLANDASHMKHVPRD